MRPLSHGVPAALAAAALITLPAPRAMAATCASSPGVVEVGAVVTGTQGPDIIDCSSLEEPRTIHGLGGDDSITGSSKGDTIVPGAGVDTVDGFKGKEDFVDAGEAPGPLTASVAGASDDGYGNDETGLWAGIERLRGSAWNDSLIGDDRGNRLEGLGGDDVLEGLGGNDTLDGGPGRDGVDFNASPDGVTVDLKDGTASGEGEDTLVSIQDVTGSSEGDTILGSTVSNTLDGGGGPDLLRGGDGDDTLNGGGGSDSLVGGNNKDTLNGGDKKDACSQGPGKGSKRSCERLAYGEAMEVAMFQPSENVIGVGFHESMFDVAVAARPHGHKDLNDNPAKFTPPDEETDGLDHVVMGTRGRPTPAASSADIVVDSASAVLSPVNGTVVEVFQYLLYCESLDWELVIQPDGRSDVLLIVLHMVDIPVKAGDRLVASITRIGTSWTNDAPTAQENQYFPDQYPHVHIEIDDDDEAPIPGCLPGQRTPPGGLSVSE